MNMSKQANGFISLFCFRQFGLVDKTLDAKIDWGQFLCSMCSFIGVHFNHMKRKSIKGMLMSKDKIVRKYVKEDIVSAKKVSN